MWAKSKLAGFTIVELLIVIVVIGILASITVVAYSGIQQRAQAAVRDTDLILLKKAILTSRVSTGKTTTAITGNGMTSYNCVRVNGNPGLVEPRELDSSHSCWVLWRLSLDRLALASGLNLSKLYQGDNRGNPYFLDENEGENNGGNYCGSDSLGYFTGNGVGVVIPISIAADRGSIC